MFFKESLLFEAEAGKKSTFAVANCILDDTENVTNLKLQKLIFLAYGLHLALYKERLYSSPIEAWKLGPVVRDMCDEFKNHGRSDITTRASFLESDNDFLVPTISDEYTKEKMSVIATCLYYGKEPASRLVDITHDMSSWKKAYDNKKVPADFIRLNEKAEILSDQNIYEDFCKIQPTIVEFVNKL